MQYSTRMFFYEKDTNEFTQEASSLRNPDFRPEQRLTLVSARTGDAKQFMLESTGANGQDIDSWTYAAVDGSGIRCTIWND